MSNMSFRKSPHYLYLIGRVLSLAIALSLAACASKSGTRDALIHDDLPPGTPNGLVEFYCTGCMAGWAIYRLDGRKEVHLAQLSLGRKVADSIQSPSRIKRLRIALEPGAHDLMIRLIPPSLIDTVGDVAGGTSKPLSISIVQDELTTVRIRFKKEANLRFTWQVNKGRSVPLARHAEARDFAVTALEGSDWETRWYGAEILGQLESEIPENILFRLQELSGRSEFRRCVKTATVEECRLVREQILQTIRKIKEARP